MPLTKNGQNYETVDRMIDKMTQAGWLDLLWLAKDIAGLVLKSKQAKQWIKERFDLMLPEILKESWVYKETIEEGMQQGIQQDREQVILRLVELRFPSLLALAKQVIERRLPLQQLQALSDKLFLVNTIEETRVILQEFESDK